MLKDCLIYLLVVNVITFAVFGIDKKKAVKHEWRIPEKVLFLFVFAGGGPGGLCGMYVFRHKTKHALFKYGVPAVTAVQIVLIVLALILFRA